MQLGQPEPAFVDRKESLVGRVTSYVVCPGCSITFVVNRGNFSYTGWYGPK